jgi:hypothetical protein
MDQFKRMFMDMLDMVLQHPPAHDQFIVVGVVSLLAGAWVFLKVCDKLDLPNVGIITGFFYATVGGAVMVAAMTAGRIWLGEWIKPMGEVVFYTLLAAIAAAGFYVPLLNTHIKGKYMGTLTAWTLGVATALAMSMLVNTGYGLTKDGKRILNRGAERNATTREAIR